MDKTYRWLKIGTDFMTSPEIRAMRAEKHGATLFAAYIDLLMFSLEFDGDLRGFAQYGNFEKELSVCSGINLQTLRRLLEFLSKRNLFLSGKLLHLSELIGKETESARRQRRSREKRARLENTSVEQLFEEEESEGESVTLSQNVTPSKKEESREKREESRVKREEDTPLPPSKGEGVEAAENEESPSGETSSKKNTKSGRDVYLEFAGENEELRQAFLDFLEMRRMMKKPVTARGARQGLTHLQSAGPPGEWVEIVNQSVEKCWLSFYALKEEEAPPGKSSAKSLYPEYEAIYQEHDKWNLFQEVGHDAPH